MKKSWILIALTVIFLQSCSSDEAVLSATDKVDRMIQQQKPGDKNFVNDIALQTNQIKTKSQTEENIDLSNKSIALKTNEQPGGTPMPTHTSTISPTPAPAKFQDVTELKIEDTKIGSGAEAADGKSISVHYTGMLTDGTIFDTSISRGTPFVFSLGSGSVIKGWDQGVKGMKVGGTRRLFIPPQLGYGSQGIPGTIPPGATLIFDVELIDVK